MINRDLFRRQAKKIYKEKTKEIPKNKRISFADFFKQYKHKHEHPDHTHTIETPKVEEDFDIGSLVNVNEISDDSLEVIEE